MIKKVGSGEVNDGREDAFLSVNGERFITIHQEGYTKMGMTYDQAKEFVTSLAELFLTCGSAAERATGSGNKTEGV